MASQNADPAIHFALGFNHSTLSHQGESSLRIVYKSMLSFKPFNLLESFKFSPSHARHLNLRSINPNKNRTGLQNKSIIMKKL